MCAGGEINCKFEVMDKEQYKREHAVKIANGIIKTANEIVSIMKKEKAARFALFEPKDKKDASVVGLIEDRDGNLAEVYKEGESWLVRLNYTNISDVAKQKKLAKAMQFWYYNNYVKGKE